MTIQTERPEATTKAGQDMESWLREPEDYEWGRKVTNAILAIEGESRRLTLGQIRDGYHGDKSHWFGQWLDSLLDESEADR